MPPDYGDYTPITVGHKTQAATPDMIPRAEAEALRDAAVEAALRRVASMFPDDGPTATEILALIPTPGALDRAIAGAEARYRVALADAIRRPMGVIPASAEGLVTTAEIDAAERRRAGKGE